MKVALDFSIGHDLFYNGKIPVLFVTFVQNYHHYTGFRMNSRKYSAHAEEKEILFMEGTEVYVMCVEEVNV